MKKISDLTGKSLTAKVQLVRYRFPEHKKDIQPGKFCIVVCQLEEIIDGDVPSKFLKPDGNYEFICKGFCMPKMEHGQTYSMTANLINDIKWGYQYDVIDMHLDYNLETEEDQRKFFSFFLTDNQIDLLFSEYDKPVELLACKRLSDLKKVKGIGPVTALKMCQKYEECKNTGRAYVKLGDLGLTKNAIDRIVQHYGSVDLAIESVLANPYTLIKDVRGFGWDKADAIAQKQGFSCNCKERVQAYANYYLQEQADSNGNSCVPITDLLANVCSVCSPLDETTAGNYIKEITANETQFSEYMLNHAVGHHEGNHPQFYYNIENRKIGLFWYRVVEKDIFYEFQRIKNAKSHMQFDPQTCKEVIEECEKEQGFEYTEEQKKAINMILHENISIITGRGGCVDCDTEYFNGSEWKRIADYTDGDQVLMYNPDGSAELVIPEAYVKYPEDHLWLTQTKYGLDMCLSEEHNVYYITSKGNLYHKSFKEVKEAHENTKGGFSGKFITSFRTNRSGMDISNEDLKVMLAVICDGSFTSPNSNNCRFHIKKDRKKAKLREIFTAANIVWRESDSAAEGYTDFYITAPRHEKEFTKDWYNCSQEQLQIICDNVLFWDGHVTDTRRSFSTNNKVTADFIQYAFSACGYRATLTFLDRSGQPYSTCGKTYVRKSVDYNVCITNRNLISMSGYHSHQEKTIIKPYTTKDGYKYCFTVPTHMWIMRRNGRIVVTGNTGKSFTLRPLIKILQRSNLTVEQCALAGRASSLLSSVTGLEGKTIHRLLKYQAELERFMYGADKPIPADVVILDETSMVGEELLLNLISAIQTGSKFIMLGDIKQLPPMAVGNVFSDALQSGYLPVTVLTKIHRQAQKSGIIMEAAHVSDGESIIKNNFAGSEIRGELQDFKITSGDDPTQIQYKVIEEFKHLYCDKKIPADDIQIIVPMRMRGDTSCRALNEIIQELVNPGKEQNTIEVTFIDNGVKYPVKFKPGDRIIINRNNYHAINGDGDECAIFNGNLGHIKMITEDIMIITLDDTNEDIMLTKDDWYNINLAYAITVHKLQGSQAPYTIVGVDYSAYALLSRELIYTALTRATKYCSLVAQPKALNTAVHTSAVKTKLTWLKEDLLNTLVQEQLKALE